MTVLAFKTPSGINLTFESGNDREFLRQTRQRGGTKRQIRSTSGHGGEGFRLGVLVLISEWGGRRTITSIRRHSGHTRPVVGLPER